MYIVVDEKILKCTLTDEMFQFTPDDKDMALAIPMKSVAEHTHLGFMHPFLLRFGHIGDDITAYVRNITVSLPGEIIEPSYDGLYFLNAQNEYEPVPSIVNESYHDAIMNYIKELENYEPF